jgi:hypothetical protein
MNLPHQLTQCAGLGLGCLPNRSGGQSAHAMSRAPDWLEPAGGTSADTLYDSVEVTESVLNDELRETVREAKKREKGIPVVRSFRQLPCWPRRR